MLFKNFASIFLKEFAMAFAAPAVVMVVKNIVILDVMWVGSNEYFDGPKNVLISLTPIDNDVRILWPSPNYSKKHLYVW